MRLLNTKTFEVNEFYTDIPLYAILSHTWEKEEVTFQNIQNLDVAKTKAGWLKVENACAHARKYTFEWIWIDTCCIDKTSSAELSEALNSMYQYYTDAEVCYVYLSDVSNKENPRDPRSRFRSSKWFTRGWTLQELLAPMYAVFLDTDWNEIGTRWSLRDAISAITTIPIEIFKCQNQIDDFSIAQKMSWAASRETTRPEDQAYCLMGIFNVNMPPIYGEGGEKAFMRLQQEIIKISGDRSIFVWMSEPSSGDSAMDYIPSMSCKDSEVRGLLAKSPYEFRESGHVTMSNTELIGDKSSFSFGNNGLHIHLPLVPVEGSDAIFLASLHCRRERTIRDHYLSIYLRRVGEKQFVRCYPNEVVMAYSQMKDLTEIVVKEYSLHRMVRRAINCDRSTQKVHVAFELSSSAELVLVRRANQQDISLGMGHVVLWPYAYQYANQEEFCCRYEARCYKNGRQVEMLRIMQNNSPAFALPNCDRSPVDREQFCLNNGLMHIRLHMGNGQRKIDINYELTDGNHQIMLLQPPSWCMVPTSIDLGTYTYSLESIFPENFFDCDSIVPNRQDYIYVPSDVNMPRLLTYHMIDGLRDWWLCIVIGFCYTGRAWTDVFFHPNFTNSRLKGIWEDYLDSTRHCEITQTSASIVLPSLLLKSPCITATVYDNEYTTLQLGSHLLKVNIQLEKPICISRVEKWV